ncbi:50S ribosomal protein L4 [Biscogniauxia mediterranea]|nr:50S ribosomal protein L4 [Biscogniauxia mediterranea]
MASKAIRGLNEAMRTLSLSSHTCREVLSRIPSSPSSSASSSSSSSLFTRSMATEAPIPNLTTTPTPTPSSPITSGSISSPRPALWRPATTVPLTIFDFPSCEPRRLESWSVKHLHLPLRRDLLHLAVVFEGDNTRQGTASSKTRWEVRGSGRKIKPQKGLGTARAGDRYSPIRRGGGKTFGPKPRDFGTKMPRKTYDLAWRTALSYRYRRGELIVCEDGMELPLPAEFEAMVQSGELKTKELHDSFIAKWTRQVLDANEWGRSNGRSTFITTNYREDLFPALDLIPNYGRAMDMEDVDVKDLLTTGRLIIEREALLGLVEHHQSDLTSSVYIVNPAFLPSQPQSGNILVQ